MENKTFYYIKGSETNPEGVIMALEEIGAENKKGYKGQSTDSLYFTDPDDFSIKCKRDNDMICKIIASSSNWVELQPVIKIKTYQDLIDNHVILPDNVWCFDSGSVEGYSKISINVEYADYRKDSAADEATIKHMLASAQISHIIKQYGGCVPFEDEASVIVIGPDGVPCTHPGVLMLGGQLRFVDEDSAVDFYANNKQLVYDYLYLPYDD